MKRSMFSRSEKDGLNLIKDTFNNILSIGISTNGNAEKEMLLLAPNAKVIATTIDKEGIKKTKNVIEKELISKQIELKLEDVREKNIYEDNYFDFIYARLILHYLTDNELKDVLNELYRILKFDELIYIVVRSDKCEERSSGFISFNPNTGMTKHKTCNGNTQERRFHSLDSIKNAVKLSGFEIVSIDEFDEQLYADYARTQIVTSRNNLIEIVGRKKNKISM